MWLVHTLGLAACAAAGAALVAWERRRGGRLDRAGSGAAAQPAAAAQRRAAARARSAAALAAALAAELGPAAGAIPPRELGPRAARIRAVVAARGWRGGRYHYAQAWARVEARAAGAAGGGWEAEFEPAGMTGARLKALADAIDEELLGGLGAPRLLRCRWERAGRGLRREGRRRPRGGGHAAAGGGEEGSAPSGRQSAALAAAAEPTGGRGPHRQAPRGLPQQPHPPHPRPPPHPPQPAALAFRVVAEPRAGWLAHYEPATRSVVVNAARWAKPVSPAAPVNCEGVVVTSRRGMLLHTIGHEIVHAIVEICFPEIDAASPAYLGPDRMRHGPIFALLNRALFGHTSEALARCDARAALGGA
jgi:hypothetical protein